MKYLEHITRENILMIGLVVFFIFAMVGAIVERDITTEDIGILIFLGAAITMLISVFLLAKRVESFFPKRIKGIDIEDYNKLFLTKKEGEKYIEKFDKDKYVKPLCIVLFGAVSILLLLLLLGLISIGKIIEADFVFILFLMFILFMFITIFFLKEYRKISTILFSNSEFRFLAVTFAVKIMPIVLLLIIVIAGGYFDEIIFLPNELKLMIGIFGFILFFGYLTLIGIKALKILKNKKLKKHK